MGSRRRRQPTEILEYREQSYKKNIVPRNEKQKEYLKALEEYPIVFGVGAAGSGKTALAVWKAVEEFDNDRINRLILVRPAVATESLGFLPGTLQQKLDPYLRPIFDSLLDRWNPEKIEKLQELDQIEIAPLAFMRGRTFNNSIVILDEAQNATVDQMRMFLTRIGENTKYFITGDPTQTDIRGENGLQWAVEKLQNCESIKIIRFENNEIVRSGLVKIILNYLED